MEVVLKILMVEDRLSDAELIKYEIKKSGFQFVAKIVETKHDYINAIHEFKPDLILSDYSLPLFDGMQALLIREELVPNIPFILITGSINEQTAVEVMKTGADDYIIKEYLTRLGSAINAAIKKKEVILAKKVAEEKLKILSRAVEQNTVSIVITDNMGRIEYVNPKFTEITGYTLDEVMGENPRVLKSDDKSPEEYKELWETITSGREWKGIFQNRKKNGELHYESATISPITDDAGITTHFVAVKEDITERRKMEEKLVREQYYMQTLLENIPDYIYFKDLESRFLRINKALAQKFGLNDPYLAKGKTDMDFFQTDHSKQAYNDEQEIIKTGRPIINKEEIENWSDRQKSSWVSTTKMPLHDAKGKIIGTFGISRSITEQKLAEDALKKSEEQFRSLYENAPIGIYRTTPEGQILMANPSLLKMLGYHSVEEFSGRNLLQAGNERNYPREEFKKKIEQNGIVVGMESAWKIKDGSTIFVSESARLFRDEKGNPMYYEGMVENITKRKKAEDRIRESEEKYKYLFQNSPLPMWIYDLKTLSFLEVNNAAIESYGYSHEEFLNMTLKDIRPEEDTKTLLADVAVTFNNYYKAGTWRHIKKNGELIYVEITSHAIDYGSKKARLVISNDITERLMAEKQIKTLSKAIEQSPSAVIITDAEGNIEFVNHKFTASTQYSLNEVIGKKPRILNPGHLSEEEYSKLWDSLHKGETWVGEMLNRRKDNSAFWEEVVISTLMKDNGTIGNYILIMNDITEKKKMLNELIQAKEKAEESDRLKTAFLHNISHEIRTPMNAIVGFSSLLKDSNFQPDKRAFFVDLITQNSQQLLAIITDIIEIATIEAGQIKTKEDKVNINAMFSFMYEQFKPKAANTGLVFSYETGLPNDNAFLITDEIKLTQILTNLISNAIKFTGQGFVKYGYMVKGSQLEFYVEDSGIGISKELHDEIFKRFRQVESSDSRQFGGSGLGLSISKSYVELLGGKIWLDSELDKGSRFYFTIPYKKTQMEVVTKNQPENEIRFEYNDHKTILVAEDEDHNYLLLQEYLSNEKIILLRAINGSEAVDICKTNPSVDMVLMDIKMPIMTGIEAAPLIKKIRPKLPIIALTAYSAESDKTKALNAGCSDFISKPVDKDHLLSKIIQWI